MGVHWRDVDKGLRLSKAAATKSLEDLEEAIRRVEVECDFYLNSTEELGRDLSYSLQKRYDDFKIDLGEVTSNIQSIKLNL